MHFKVIRYEKKMTLRDVTVKKNPVTVTIKSVSWQQLILVKSITIAHREKWMVTDYRTS